ncbi:TPA: hypothetical protein U1405_000016 [Streptococcus suis]|uniref:hypothetical protein n=1 Tax=Streptococcus suis TaxID=1307 RepID=UPI00022F93B3|nr:hypothetical protein [Streptococcus suis]AGE61221.1 hypothetical protein ST1_0016 [Streptococcus phage phiST1]AER21678.1 hypothetical protein SSUST1_1322 [Streptococcus suis ST1]MDW8592816.1 hypothetical protein [Streptococcus suis]MDW8622341.1 hypothetical protein [Streptococcus suis]NQK00174.1 hypothetical protein [Streptococcus suis]
MALYKATKNLVFQSLGKGVIVDEVIDLDPDYAEKVNNDLKLTFPDVDAVLVPVATTESVEVEQPKKTTRKKKVEDTETAEDAAE